ISWGYSRRDGRIFCEYAADHTNEQYNSIYESTRLKHDNMRKIGLKIAAPPCTVLDSIESIVAENLGRFVRKSHSIVCTTLETIGLPWKSSESFVEQMLQQANCQTTRSADGGGKLFVQIPKGTEIKGWRRPKQGKDNVYWSFIFRLNGGSVILQ